MSEPAPSRAPDGWLDGHLGGWLGPLASVAAGIAWFVLAWRTPTTTYHFSPIIVAAAWPMLHVPGRSPNGRVVPILSTSLAAGVGLVLAATEHLEGPTFVSNDGALNEVLLFSVIGGSVGFVAIQRAQR